MRISRRRLKHITLRMLLIAILVGVFLWSYVLFSQNYERIELSHRLINALLEDKTELAQKYADQLGLAQANLDRTEAFLKDVKEENLKLKEKVKLLDQLNDMEKEIGRLKEENAKIQSQMLKTNQEASEAKEKRLFFNTVEKGKELIAKFKQQVRDVKSRMRVIKKKEHKKKVVIQKEIDRKESLLGNNGYLIKDGEIMPVDMPDVDKMPEGVKVNVEFVK